MASSALLQRRDALRQRLLIDLRIHAVGDHREATLEILVAPALVSRHETCSLAVRTRRAYHLRNRGEVIGMFELARYAHEIGQIEMPDPQHVDVRQRRDRRRVLDALGGFDLRDDEIATMRGFDLLDRASG